MKIMTPKKKTSKAVKKSTKKSTPTKKPIKKSSAKKKTSKKTTKKAVAKKKTSKKTTKKAVAKKKTSKKTTKKEKGVKKTSPIKKVKDSKVKAEDIKKEKVKKEEKVEKELTEEEKEQQEEEEQEKKLRYESFKKAGEIHKQVVKFIKPKIKIGAKLLDICEGVEKKLSELGGEIGFPTNICINEIAAHYTSPPEDESVIMEGDIVKIDIGVSVEGYVADGAFTVSFNKEPETENLVMAVETAVLKGLSIIKPGIKTVEVGKVTSKIIRGFGYHPIKDLHGHSLEKWQVHGFKEIPNVGISSGDVFEEGDVFALECFANSGGLGNIHNGTICNIYAYDLNTERVPIRMKITRRVIGWITQNKKTLPFSTRELLKEFRTGKMALRELTTAGKLHKHFEIRAEKGTYVSQFEKTFIVTDKGIEVFN